MHPADIRKQVHELIFASARPYCVVFDLDDTLLHIGRDGLSTSLVHQRQKSANVPPVQDLVLLYQELLANQKWNKVQLLILTARPRALEEATRKNLAHVGVDAPNLFFAKNKAKVRATCSYPVINIGDRHRDFAGGYWTHAFRVSR